uniref:Uncharacterized protein n=1 Tax=viral metagenome TaxID=1070528 RepID=A0A6C0FGS6_9ZZZZ|tara:strand:- start:2364 stop:3314 length:951 start_codon:yes stop_codon:yes gene_type:complete
MNQQRLEQSLGVSPNEALADRGTDIIKNIKELQKTEQALFDQLQAGAASMTMSEDDMRKIVDSIKNVADTRNSLYLELEKNQRYYQKSVGASQNILTQETDALEIVERELHRAEERIGLIQEQRSNRLRLVEINRYYGDKYKHHTLILQYVTVVFSLVLILSYLYNQGFMPPFVFTTLFVIVGCVGLYYIIKESWDAYSRDNMMYQQYDWAKLKGRPDEVGSPSTEKNPWEQDIKQDQCVGQQCCRIGHTWIKAPLNKCYPNSELRSNADILAAFPEGYPAFNISQTSGEDLPNMGSGVLGSTQTAQQFSIAMSGG